MPTLSQPLILKVPQQTWHPDGEISMSILTRARCLSAGTLVATASAVALVASPAVCGDEAACPRAGGTPGGRDSSCPGPRSRTLCSSRRVCPSFTGSPGSPRSSARLRAFRTSLKRRSHESWNPSEPSASPSRSSMKDDHGCSATADPAACSRHGSPEPRRARSRKSRPSKNTDRPWTGPSSSSPRRRTNRFRPTACSPWPWTTMTQEPSPWVSTTSATSLRTSEPPWPRWRSYWPSP